METSIAGLLRGWRPVFPQNTVCLASYRHFVGAGGERGGCRPIRKWGERCRWVTEPEKLLCSRLPPAQCAATELCPKLSQPFALASIAHIKLRIYHCNSRYLKKLVQLISLSLGRIFHYNSASSLCWFSNRYSTWTILAASIIGCNYNLYTQCHLQ